MSWCSYFPPSILLPIRFIASECLLLHTSHIMAKGWRSRLYAKKLFCGDLIQQYYNFEYALTLFVRGVYALFRGKYNPCFLSFTYLMLMITFVQYKYVSYIFAAHVPLPWSLSQIIHWWRVDLLLLGRRMYILEWCLHDAKENELIDVSMTPKKMKQICNMYKSCDMKVQICIFCRFEGSKYIWWQKYVDWAYEAIQLLQV
jgi:hypothetical protein